MERTKIPRGTDVPGRIASGRTGPGMLLFIHFHLKFIQFLRNFTLLFFRWFIALLKFFQVLVERGNRSKTDLRTQQPRDVMSLVSIGSCTNSASIFSDDIPTKFFKLYLQKNIFFLLQVPLIGLYHTVHQSRSLRLTGEIIFLHFHLITVVLSSFSDSSWLWASSGFSLLSGFIFLTSSF